MNQRLDDVTGREIAPLSARQREQQREAMIHQINAMTLQLNTLTAEAKSVREWREFCEERLHALKLHDSTVLAVIDVHVHRTLWQRLRWVLVGR